MQFLKLSAAILVTFLYTGCGNGASGLDTAAFTPHVDLRNLTYFIPENITTEDTEPIDSQTQILTSLGNQEVSGFVYDAGLQQVDANSTLNLGEKLNEYVKKIRGSELTTQISNLTMRDYGATRGYIVAQYQLRTARSLSPLNVTAELLKLLTDNTQEITLHEKSTAPQDSKFRLRLIVGKIKNRLYYTLSLTPEDLARQNSLLLEHMVNNANIGPNPGVLRNEHEAIIYERSGESNMTDFIFMVDDSGSMGDDQEAIRNAGEDFGDVIENFGLDYTISILTTSCGTSDDDSCTYDYNGTTFNWASYDRVINEIGIIHNDIDLFKQHIVVGTQGSPQETGIYNAEAALGENGILHQYGIPREDASQVMIIISDEPSQYESKSGGDPFDPKHNIFIDNDMLVYAIIEPDEDNETGLVIGYDLANQSQYDDLAQQTGGLLANIKNRDENGDLDFSSIMQIIAQDASEANSAVRLHRAAIINRHTLVKINGVPIPQSQERGWTYSQSLKALIFHGNAKPHKGDRIEVVYQYVDRPEK